MNTQVHQLDDQFRIVYNQRRIHDDDDDGPLRLTKNFFFEGRSKDRLDADRWLTFYSCSCLSNWKGTILEYKEEGKLLFECSRHILMDCFEPVATCNDSMHHKIINDFRITRKVTKGSIININLGIEKYAQDRLNNPCWHPIYHACYNQLSHGDLIPPAYDATGEVPKELVIKLIANYFELDNKQTKEKDNEVAE